MATNQTTSAVNDIRDIKPPIVIPTGWEWLWWSLGVLAVAAIAFALVRWWLKKRAQVTVVPIVPAHVRARQKLRQALQLLTQPKPFCIAVSDAVRAYLEERFEFRAPERTTEEFLRELTATDLLAAQQKESLGTFLATCDLVKFAKHELGEKELRELYGAAMRLVDETVPSEVQSPESKDQSQEAA